MQRHQLERTFSGRVWYDNTGTALREIGFEIADWLQLA